MHGTSSCQYKVHLCVTKSTYKLWFSLTGQLGALPILRNHFYFLDPTLSQNCYIFIIWPPKTINDQYSMKTLQNLDGKAPLITDPPQLGSPLCSKKKKRIFLNVTPDMWHGTDEGLCEPSLKVFWRYFQKPSENQLRKPKKTIESLTAVKPTLNSPPPPPPLTPLGFFFWGGGGVGEKAQGGGGVIV